MAMLETGKRRAAPLGIDSHILMTLLFRGWSAISGALTVLLVPFFLGKTEQGIYFTLLSLVAIQVFFELGLNQIIVQLVGFEVVHLQREASGAISGDRWRIETVVAQVALFRRWYLVASGLFFVGAGAGGSLFLYWTQSEVWPDVAPVWWLLVLCNTVVLYVSPSLAVLEGFGDVDRIARLRLMQSVGGYGMLLVLLLAGAGIWSVLALSLTAALVSGWFVLRGSVQLQWLAAQKVRPGILNWRADILPLQWRIALSWISGYIIMQLFVPIAFARYGPVPAGQLGVTLSVFTSIQTLGASWIVARMPVFSGLVSTRARGKLAKVFAASFWRALFFVVVVSVVSVVLLRLLPEGWRARFASDAVVVALCVNVIVNTIVFALACFMRAHREEPMAPVSVALALAMVPILLFSGRYGMERMIFLYVAANCIIALPWTVMLFRRYWTRTEQPC